MIHSAFRQMLAAAVLSLAFTGAASAQSYDGSVIVRFGVFGAGESYDIKSLPDTLGSVSVDGAAIGFAAGYDLVFARRMVLGIEADLTVGDNGDRLAGIAVRSDYMATLRGRVGFFLMPELLLYGTGGVAWAGLAVENTLAATGSDIDSNKTVPGWVAGGGLEYDLRDYFGTLLFAEYLVGGFDSWSRVPGLNLDLDADVQTFRIGVKFKVGHDYHEDSRRGGPLK